MAKEDKELLAFSERYMEYICKLHLAKPIHPEIKGGYFLYQEVVDLLPKEIIKLFAIIPELYINGEMMISAYTSNINMVKIISNYLKSSFHFEKVLCTYSAGKDMEYLKELVLTTLKKYYDIEYSKEELKALERGTGCIGSKP